MEFTWYNPIHYTQEIIKKYSSYIVKHNTLYDTYEEPIYKSNPILTKNNSRMKQLLVPIFNNRQYLNNPMNINSMTISNNLKNQIIF
jgi:hypothetical protein